jgi:hypothetical protein
MSYIISKSLILDRDQIDLTILFFIKRKEKKKVIVFKQIINKNINVHKMGFFYLAKIHTIISENPKEMLKKEGFPKTHLKVDSNLGDCHYGAIVKDSNNEHHEGREVKLPNQCQEQKPNHNPNSDRYSIYRIIFHALEYATTSKNRVDNHTQPYSFNHVSRMRIRYISTTKIHIHI